MTIPYHNDEQWFAECEAQANAAEAERKIERLKREQRGVQHRLRNQGSNTPAARREVRGKPTPLTTDAGPLEAKHLADEKERARRRRKSILAKVEADMPGPYEHTGASFFRDLAIEAEVAYLKDQALRTGSMRVDEVRDIMRFAESPHRDVDMSYRAVSKRLAAHRTKAWQAAEQRDLTSATTAGGDFVPALGGFLSELFTTAATAQMSLAGALSPRPLPPTGMTVDIPRISSVPTVVSQATEGSTAGETDFTTTKPGAEVATIAGFIDASQQLVDRSEHLDEAVSMALGEAIGAEIERQVWAGTGSSAQLEGLLTWSGTTSTAYTDASATVQEFLTALMKCWSTTASASKRSPSIISMHPRRLAWTMSTSDGATGQQVTLAYPDGSRIVPSSACPTNLGASTNEDAVLVIDPAGVEFLLGPVNVHAVINPLGGTLQVRYIAHRYGALVVSNPTSVGKLTGTGLISVTGF